MDSFSLQWNIKPDLSAPRCLLLFWMESWMCLRLQSSLRLSAVFGCGWITKRTGSAGRRGNRQTTQWLWYSPRLSAALQRAQYTADQPIRGNSVWRKVLHLHLGFPVKIQKMPHPFCLTKMWGWTGMCYPPLAPDAITSEPWRFELLPARCFQDVKLSCAPRGGEQSEPETSLVDVSQKKKRIHLNSHDVMWTCGCVCPQYVEDRSSLWLTALQQHS